MTATGGEYYVRLEERSLWTKDEPKVRSPRIATAHTSSRAFKRQGYRAPIRRYSLRVPRARKSRFPKFPDERDHPLPVHLVDQTLPPPTDHQATTPHHPPTLSHWTSTTSLVATHPGAHQNRSVAPRSQLYRLWTRRRPQPSHSRTDR